MRPGFPFAHHSRGRNKGAIQDQQQSKHTGDDKPRIDQTRVVEKRGLKLHLAATGEVRSGNLLHADMNPLLPQSAVVSLDHAFRISPADRGGICIRGVQQELNSGRAIARQVPRIVVRNHHPRVDASLG